LRYRRVERSHYTPSFIPSSQAQLREHDATVRHVLDILYLGLNHNISPLRFIERTLSVVGADMVGVEIFVEEMCAFVCSVTEENKDRARGHVRNIEEYLFLRRKTCGARPTFYFLALGMNIPKHVFEHPTMRSLIDCATDLIAVINVSVLVLLQSPVVDCQLQDMHSYGLEVSTGLADHNILTIIMHEYRVDAQAAVWWLSGYAAKGVAQFKLDSQALPSWGPHVDNNIQEFVRMVAQCVKGSDAWSYETERYYGKKGGRIQRTRKVALPSRAGRLSLLFTNNR